MNHWFDPAHFCWGIDVSHYRPNLDWSILKAAGISFAIAKASESTDYKDDTFADHCQKAYDFDVLFSGYHYMDPMYYVTYAPERTPPEKDAQLQNFLGAIKNKKIYGAFMDHERWWESYDQWYAARRGEIPGSAVKKIDPGWISKAGQTMVDRVNKATGLPTGVYSSLSFIEGYAPKTKDWVDPCIQFTAYYPYSTTVVQVQSWAEFFEQYAPPFPLKYDLDRDGVAEEHSSPPWWTNHQPQFWQFTGDKFCMPGVQDGRKINLTTDIDLFFGSQEELYRLYAFTPRDTQPPTPPPADPGDNGDAGQGDVDPVALAEVMAMLAENRLVLEENNVLLKKVAPHFAV